MCGIFGYIGNKNSVPILIEGLKKLEYRGYDSAGICIKVGNNLRLFKKRGRISELKKEIPKKLNSTIGIAHTRWATHGKPSKLNAHPHFDCKKEIAIVHNGIIENYHALKTLVESEGHKIVSQTDSEIIAHLIEKFYHGNLEEALIKALKCIVGAYGLAVIHKNEEKILAARKSSPLVIGIGKNEAFIASDAVPIIEHTKNIIYLDDNEIAIITRNGYTIKDINGEEINKEIHKIKWKAGEIQKKGFKHFTLKEIFEQPEAVLNTLRGRIKQGKIKLSIDIDVNNINRIIIIACGTSWHSALIGKYIIEDLTRIPVEVDYASEFRYRNPILTKNDLVIAISQSGETADTLEALRKAKASKVRTLGIVNVVGSTIAREVDSGIYLHAGPEIGVASTKAFTCQIIALLLLALFICQEKNMKINKNILNSLTSIHNKIKDILKRAKEIKRIAKAYKDAKNFLYLGRNIDFPVALEAALKLKEISYIHAEGYPAAEMKHGPIALIDENMPTVFIATDNDLIEKIISNMQEIKSRNGKIITITHKKSKAIEKLSDEIFIIPQAHKYLMPILSIIPLQLLAYYIADFKGLDIDKPRNLAKSVTVE